MKSCFVKHKMSWLQRRLSMQSQHPAGRLVTDVGVRGINEALVPFCDITKG